MFSSATPAPQIDIATAAHSFSISLLAAISHSDTLTEMDTLLCLKCGHEFPAEGAKRKPDKTGLIIFGGMGGILLLFAVAAFAVALPYYWNTSDRTTVVYGGMLAVLAGLAGIGLGLALRKGMYAYCPACGLPRALPSASSSAKDFKRRQAKG